ncbi:hypothetical protein [Sphingomonas sp.]|uniref:hypothetical protein n=1 Tax=Sphingomonas sp. TaxID=28214 RepID=UPI001EBF97BB|nr:hypothetical protein [Sphingomonas sp.]MBX3593010.1 hypothetical protein [Sphingomonas sp.]
MLAMTMVLVWAALVIAGPTRTGSVMRAILVERPARWLGRFTRGQVIVLGGAVLFGALLFWIMEEEGLRLASMYAPDLMALAASAEFTTAIDAIMVAILTAGSLRLRGIGGWIGARLSRPRVRTARRGRRTRRVPPPANDDDRAVTARAA